MIDKYVGLVWYLVCGFSSIKKVLVHAKCVAIMLLLSTLDKLTLESSTTKHIDPEMYVGYGSLALNCYRE